MIPSETRSGLCFDLETIDPVKVRFVDIVSHLAALNRFNGAVDWSVAAHSCYAEDLLPHGTPPLLRPHGTLWRVWRVPAGMHGGVGRCAISGASAGPRQPDVQGPLRDPHPGPGYRGRPYAVADAVPDAVAQFETQFLTKRSLPKRQTDN